MQQALITTGIIDEASSVQAVSSPRSPERSAARYVIDRIKSEVPSWEDEVFEEGEVWTEGQNARGRHCW